MLLIERPCCPLLSGHIPDPAPVGSLSCPPLALQYPPRGHLRPDVAARSRANARDFRGLVRGTWTIVERSPELGSRWVGVCCACGTRAVFDSRSLARNVKIPCLTCCPTTPKGSRWSHRVIT